MFPEKTHPSPSLRLIYAFWPAVISVLQRLSSGHGAGCRKRGRAFPRTSSALLPLLCPSHWSHEPHLCCCLEHLASSLQHKLPPLSRSPSAGAWKLQKPFLC